MRKQIAVSLILVLFVATAAMAQQFGQRPGGGKGGNCGMPPGCEMGGHRGNGGPGVGMLLGMADDLNLTETQQKQLQAMMQKNGIEQIEKKAELEKAELNLRHLRMNDASDNEILAAIDQVGELKTDMQKMRFRHRSAAESVLTAEQKDKLTELRKEFRQNRPGCRQGQGQGMGQGMGKGFGMNAPDFDEDDADNNPPYRSGRWGN